MGETSRDSFDEERNSRPELRKVIEELFAANGLNYCLECGKCSALCPMLEFYGEYSYERSPRGVVEQLIIDPEGTETEALWYCLACHECTRYCPSGVTFQNFIIGLREDLVERGYRKHARFCDVCGSYLMPAKEFEYLRKRPDSKLDDGLLATCLRCKREHYRKVVHRSARWPKEGGAKGNEPVSQS
ncbi:MAG: 4Fe-4S dicluster domain-containing protein [Deltaproteobacteria bacterium]|nr:4Fe-4S dicluster domain-containing protein [Deltaproteobacteria bacterium]MBW2137066.1 4Fe-4S dicluster domain-containing protein [Deltaproteobacteria bacterium]